MIQEDLMFHNKQLIAMQLWYSKDVDERADHPENHTYIYPQGDEPWRPVIHKNTLPMQIMQTIIA